MLRTKHNGGIILREPVVAFINSVEYPVLCDKQELETAEAIQYLRRFPTRDLQTPYKRYYASNGGCTIIAPIEEDHATVTPSNKWVFDDLLNGLNHVGSISFVLPSTFENIKKVYDGLHKLAGSYPYLGVPKVMRNVHDVAGESNQLVVTVYKANRVFSAYLDNVLDALAIAVEVGHAENSGLNNDYYGMYLVFSMEQTPLFYLDGETAMKNKLTVPDELLKLFRGRRDHKVKKKVYKPKERLFEQEVVTDEEWLEEPVEVGYIAEPEPEISTSEMLEEATKLHVKLEKYRKGYGGGRVATKAKKMQTKKVVPSWTYKSFKYGDEPITATGFSNVEASSQIKVASTGLKAAEAREDMECRTVNIDIEQLRHKAKKVAAANLFENNPFEDL